MLFFVPLPSNSGRFQQQLITKSETRIGFKLSGNHLYIKRKISSNRNVRNTKEMYLLLSSYNEKKMKEKLGGISLPVCVSMKIVNVR